MQVIKSNMYNSPPSPYHEEYNCKVTCSLLLKERRGRRGGERERERQTDRQRQKQTDRQRQRV